MRLFLFGRARLTDDGEPRKFAALPRALPLLALVAVRGAAPVSREAIAFALWPDDGERDARANLRRHIHSVRKALPPECDPFVLDDAHVAWNAASSLWCDVVAFERERVAKRFDIALDLYAGPLLEDSLEEAVVAERERMQNIFVTLGVERVRSARAEGNLARAIEVAQRVNAADPWREDVIRTLMELRFEDGDRAGALDVYERFERRLGAELGVEPMAETAALRARLAASVPRPSASDVGASLELRFVERERELEELASAVAFERAERPCVALVGGAAGIGKTRLLAEFAERFEARGGRVAGGALPDGGERTPYRSLVTALQPFAMQLHERIDAPRADLLATFFEAADAAKLERSQTLVFDAFAAAFEALANDAPLLVIIEDAHWAGEATAAALAFLARRFMRSRITLVISYRSEALGRGSAIASVIDDLAAGGAAAIVVRPLSRAGARAAAAALGERAHEIVDELARLAEGNPFYLGELLRDRLERPGASDVPATIGDAIERRLERLDDRARTLLETAAIVGDTFVFELAAAVAGLGESEAREALDTLIERRLVREGGRRLRYRFAFAHQLIRSHVYESMPRDVLDRRHLRIATTLERRQRDDDAAAELAEHFDRGGDFERAAFYSLIAARRFAAVAAFDEALRHAERGIALARDPELRFDLLLAREAVAVARGDRERQAESLAAASVLANELGDATRTFELLDRRISHWRAIGDRARESAAVGELFELARSLHDPVYDARALMQRARTAVLLENNDPLGDINHAIRLLDAAGESRALLEAYCDALQIFAILRRPFEEAGFLEAARRLSARLGDAESEIVYLEAALLANLLTNPQRVVADGERLCVMLSQRGERERLAQTHQRMALALVRVDRPARALEYALRARRLYEELAKPQGIAGISIALATAYTQLGRSAQALEHLDRAYETFAGLSDVRGCAIARMNRATVALEAGDFAAGLRAGEHAVALAEAFGEASFIAIARANRGSVRFWAHDYARAVDDLRARGEELGGDSDATTDDRAHYALALLGAGELEAAGRIADEIAAATADSALEGRVGAFAGYALATVARARGDRSGARDALERARVSLAGYFAALEPAADRDALARVTQTAAVLDALREAGLDVIETARR